MLVIFKNFEIRSSSSREIETAKKKKKYTRDLTRKATYSGEEKNAYSPAKETARTVAILAFSART